MCINYNYKCTMFVSLSVLLSIVYLTGAMEYPSHEELKILSKNISETLDNLAKNYDKRVRPNYGKEAVEVGITMFVLSISSFSEVEMDFTLDFYFRQMWKDTRLKFYGPKGVETISVSSDFLGSIWVPDTFFVNEKTSYFHTATTSNEFLRISQSGDILRSLRLTVTATCYMNLGFFPMDSQLCALEIESYGYTMSDIKYVWAKGAGSVGVEDDVSLPQFKVVGYRQTEDTFVLASGNYSRLACEIQFVRSMGFYLIQVYIPATLIVAISWVSFWVNRNAAPARVYLGVTTVLTMTTLMGSTNKELPKISYVKSIDVFLGTCFVMVFAALLEYAVVGYMAKRIQLRKNHFQALSKMATQLKEKRREAEMADYNLRRQRYEEQMMEQSALQRYQRGWGYEQACIAEPELPEPEPGVDLRRIITINPNQICGITPSDIDKYSRLVFPVCFFVFHLIYWIVYLSISTIDTSALTLLKPT